jgi:CsoR family transcriptional regulator, copper-sensing transcriptional repressor
VRSAPGGWPAASDAAQPRENGRSVRSLPTVRASTPPPYTAGMAQAGTTAHGYTANKAALLTRLKRIEGQVRGVEGMVVDDRYCIDVVTQITAIQAALDKVALGLLEDHASHCVIGGSEDGAEERTAELMGAVKRLLRHG